MSPRARRSHAAEAVPFAWGGEVPFARSQPEAPHPFVNTAAPAGPHEPLPESPAVTGDQQASLALLEREAFAKGYAQGEKAGAEAGLKRGEAMLRRLGEALDEIAALRRQILQQSERQLVELALAIARRVVRKEIAVDQEILSALARVALDRLGDATGATIRLNPDDLATVSPGQVERWAAARVSVVADSSLARGACLVESPFGFVDAGIDAQFQELARTLLDGDHAGLEMVPRR